MTIDVPEADGPLPAAVPTSVYPVALYGFARAKPGRQADLLRVITATVTRTRAAPGCEQYEVHTTAETPDVLVFYERWSSGPELLRHMQQPSTRSFLASVGDLLERPFEAHWLAPVAV